MDDYAAGRLRIELVWGAQLFSASNFNVHPAAGSDPSGKQTHDSAHDEGNNWNEFAPSAMTCLVMALDMLRLNRALLERYGSRLSINHLDRTLKTLECGYWHAYCFNSNLSLRLRLQQRSFMENNGVKTLPHLLDQEVLALECLVQNVFSFYVEDKNRDLPMEEFIKPWVQR